MLAIIGGTGIYKIEALNIQKEIEVETPFGTPSSPIIQANYNNQNVLFLPRHGKNHQILPHEINYRANIFALKKLGAKQVLGFSATGSLRENIHPGEFCIPNQYFDFVKGNRIKTYFGEGLVAHVSTAEPTCKDLTQWVQNQACEMNMTMHTNKTYACVDGPRLGTKAESHFLRTIGCDLLGMTNVPEAFLAREAQLCYTTITMVTDYDCWMDDPKHHVSVAEVMAKYQQSVQTAKKLLLALLKTPLPPINQSYRQSLNHALLTPKHLMSPDQKQLLEVLQT